MGTGTGEQMGKSKGYKISNTFYGFDKYVAWDFHDAFHDSSQAASQQKIRKVICHRTLPTWHLTVRPSQWNSISLKRLMTWVRFNSFLDTGLDLADSQQKTDLTPDFLRILMSLLWGILRYFDHSTSRFKATDDESEQNQKGRHEYL